MKSMCFLFLALNLGFSQVLLIDSIINPGRWVNPDSIRVSDDRYGVPSGGNDNIVVAIVNPTDTINYRLDSVKVRLEQHVSDTATAFWYVIPIIWGRPGTATPQQPGSLSDVTLSFNISASVASWYNLVGLDVDLRPVKQGGATPSWFADYLYVYAFVTVGILEDKNLVLHKAKLIIPSIAHNELTFTYHLDEPGKVSIAIYSALGNKVLQERVNSKSGMNTVTLKEVGRFSPGVYFLKLTSTDQSDAQYGKTGKFVILH